MLMMVIVAVGVMVVVADFGELEELVMLHVSLMTITQFGVSELARAQTSSA